MSRNRDILYRQAGLFRKAVGNTGAGYVEKIQDKFGEFQHSLVREHFDGVGLEVSKGGSYESALGYSRFRSFCIDCEAAVVHNKMSMEIYKFIKSIEVLKRRLNTNSDFTDLLWEYSPDWNVVTGKSTVTLVLVGELGFHGECGSVISWYRIASGMVWEAYSLLDLLMYLSRMFDVDLLAYNTIRIVCGTARMVSDRAVVSSGVPVTCIKLIHNAISERYFIKVRMLNEASQ